jgi:thiol-disulfide isomerase/thioredoxin
VRVVALVALLALVACSNTHAGRRATPDPDTGPPCIPASTPAASASPVPHDANGPKAPDLALACFAGGSEVRIDQLNRPAVINLWGSWCTPCRKELPALNTFAQKNTVLVVGIATEDSRSAAGSIVDDLALSFPNLYDRDGKLHKALGSLPMPITLFLNADGTVAYTHRAGALDTAGFEQLAREHLGVA